MKSIAQKLDQIEGLLGTPDLTRWEQGFVKSIRERMKGSRSTVMLTDKQVETIDQIYEKHFE